MSKFFLTYCSVFLCIFVLGLSHFEGSSSVFENLETKDVEVKLEGEKEEMIASYHLLELHQTMLLYSKTHSFIELSLSDYEVYLKEEDKPPRQFS